MWKMSFCAYATMLFFSSSGNNVHLLHMPRKHFSSVMRKPWCALILLEKWKSSCFTFRLIPRFYFDLRCIVKVRPPLIHFFELLIWLSMQLPLQLHSAAVVLEFINFISEFPFFWFYMCYQYRYADFICVFEQKWKTTAVILLPPTFYFMAHSLRVGFKY